MRQGGKLLTITNIPDLSAIASIILTLFLNNVFDSIMYMGKISPKMEKTIRDWVKEIGARDESDISAYYEKMVTGYYRTVDLLEEIDELRSELSMLKTLNYNQQKSIEAQLHIEKSYQLEIKALKEELEDRTKDWNDLRFLNWAEVTKTMKAIITELTRKVVKLETKLKKKRKKQ